MIGGVNIPPVEATASTAPATCGLKPIRFIKGIVNVPVVTTFAAGEPEIIPIRAEERIAVFAGPPRKRPAPAKAISTNHWPAPNVSRKLPKMTKHTI